MHIHKNWYWEFPRVRSSVARINNILILQESWWNFWWQSSWMNSHLLLFCFCCYLFTLWELNLNPHSAGLKTRMLFRNLYLNQRMFNRAWWNILKGLESRPLIVICQALHKIWCRHDTQTYQLSALMTDKTVPNTLQNFM